MKVLVVDDEKLSLEKIKEQVSQISFVTEIAALDNPFHALELLMQHSYDVAILDIEMFGINGIELAKQCKCLRPNIKIIFLTGYSNYAVNAFQIHANGYLLKPASLTEIENELKHIQLPVSQPDMPKVRIQTFGNFEVFVNGRPIHFERLKAKELLAYLVSKKGAFVNNDELHSILFEDKPVTISSKSQLRNLVASLNKSLKQAQIEELIIKGRNQVAVDTSVFSCDYYDFIKGDVSTINSFMGEFMNNYSWAEFITGYLEQQSMDSFK